MNIQFNIMDGLFQVRKSDFVEAFLKEFPKVKKKEIEKDLTAVNRDYKIQLYHNKGFIFDWGELISGGINWGRFISSINIDNPYEIVTVGGNFTGFDFDAIHPNIYKKPTDINLPTNTSGFMIRICLGYEHEIKFRDLVRMGYIHAALQIPRNIFKNNKQGDGLWNRFKLRKCKICDDNIEKDVICKKCKEIKLSLSLNNTTCDEQVT